MVLSPFEQGRWEHAVDQLGPLEVGVDSIEPLRLMLPLSQGAVVDPGVLLDMIHRNVNDGLLTDEQIEDAIVVTQQAILSGDPAAAIERHWRYGEEDGRKFMEFQPEGLNDV